MKYSTSTCWGRPDSTLSSEIEEEKTATEVPCKDTPRGPEEEEEEEEEEGELELVGSGELRAVSVISEASPASAMDGVSSGEVVRLDEVDEGWMLKNEPYTRYVSLSPSST